MSDDGTRVRIGTDLEITVSGKSYPVQLCGTQFTVHLGEDNDVEAPSYGELRDRLKNKELVRFELEITTARGRDATITGFHAANGNMLVRWAGGSTSQEYPSRLTGSMPRLDEQDRVEFGKLTQEVTDARVAWQKFVDDRKFPDIEKAAHEARRLAGGVGA